MPDIFALPVKGEPPYWVRPFDAVAAARHLEMTRETERLQREARWAREAGETKAKEQKRE